MKLTINYDECSREWHDQCGSWYKLDELEREQFEYALDGIDSITEENMQRLFDLGVSHENRMLADLIKIPNISKDAHTKPIVDTHVKAAQRLLKGDSDDLWQQLNAAFGVVEPEPHVPDSEELIAYKIAKHMARMNDELRKAIIGVAFAKMSRAEAEGIQGIMNHIPFEITFPFGDERYGYSGDNFAKAWEEHHPGESVRNEPDAF